MIIPAPNVIFDREAEEEVCICVSHPFGQRNTLHCAERKVNLLGN